MYLLVGVNFSTIDYFALEQQFLTDLGDMSLLAQMIAL